MDANRVAEDAARVFDALLAGGVAILPLDVAYAVVGVKQRAIEAIFAAKARSFDKPSGMFGSWALSREIHVMPEERHAMAREIVEQEKLPFSIDVNVQFHGGWLSEFYPQASPDVGWPGPG